MAGRWLVKSDPDDYSFADLRRDGRTAWEGVGNALAIRHLRAMREGDPVLVYETGSVRAVVGLARVASAPRPDPADPSGKRVVVDLAAGAPLPAAVPMAAIRGEAALADCPLVRIGRLSVMPITAPEWDRILALAEQGPGPRR